MTASNTIINPAIIAKEALMQLDNNLVMGSTVHRGYEDEFDKKHNGFKVGDTISVARPHRYTVRSGATASPQNSVAGKFSLAVDVQEGVDLQFQSSDMTLKVSEFSDKYIKPAMIQLANSVDAKLLALYKKVWNWTGTPGEVINSFADFGKAPQRLTEMAVPSGERVGVLSPADKWGLLGSLTSLNIQGTNKNALERAKLPMIGDVDLYETQNVQVHTVGVATGTPLVNGANQNVTYATAKDTNTQSLITDGWTNSTTGILKAGDVFTIAGVYAINPVTKAVMSYLQQFVVLADADSGASTGPSTLSIAPAIITSGAYQTVSAAPADDAAITVLGTGAGKYPQNLVLHPKAFALVMVPMELPEGAVKAHRETYKGLSVRVIPYYDGTNDVGNWRLDILYGVKAIYPDLATRASGTG
jgi:hypothetical protein